jgi:hypothetical protein
MEREIAYGFTAKTIPGAKWMMISSMGHLLAPEFDSMILDKIIRHFQG